MNRIHKTYARILVIGLVGAGLIAVSGIAQADATVTRRKSLSTINPKQQLRNLPVTRKKDRATVPAGEPSPSDPSKTYPRDTMSLPGEAKDAPFKRGTGSFEGVGRSRSGTDPRAIRGESEVPPELPSFTGPSNVSIRQNLVTVEPVPGAVWLVEPEPVIIPFRMELIGVPLDVETVPPSDVYVQSEGGPPVKLGNPFASLPESNRAAARAFLMLIGPPEKETTGKSETDDES